MLPDCAENWQNHALSIPEGCGILKANFRSNPGWQTAPDFQPLNRSNCGLFNFTQCVGALCLQGRSLKDVHLSSNARSGFAPNFKSWNCYNLASDCLISLKLCMWLHYRSAEFVQWLKATFDDKVGSTGGGSYWAGRAARPLLGPSALNF